jgi:hypothetical protein
MPPIELIEGAAHPPHHPVDELQICQVCSLIENGHSSVHLPAFATPPSGASRCASGRL